MTRRQTVLMFAGTTLLALVLRVVQVLLMADADINPHWLRPVMDAAVYDGMARGLLTGGWPPPSEPFFSAPLYPYLLGMLYAVFGADNTLPVMLVHALLSSLGAGLAALVAARLWGRTEGWVAGVLYAVCWTSIFFAAEMLAVSLTVPLLLAALWLLLRGLDEAGRFDLLLSGLALGLACAARPNLLVLAPVWLWFAWRPRSARWWALALGVVLAIAPITLHNLVRGGAPVLIANSGGVNFYIGNHQGADGASVSLPGIPASRHDMPTNLARAAEDESGLLLDPVAVDRHFLAKGLRFWTEQPGQALALQVRKLGLLVGMYERSNTKHLYFWRDRSALLKLPVWLGWTPVMLLAALGLWRGDLDPARRRLLILSLVVAGLVLTLFFVNGRFRLPLLALLTVPAGGGAMWLWQSWRARRWDIRSWGIPRGALITVALLAAVSIGPELRAYSPRAGFGDPAIWYSLGQSYQVAGNDHRAIQSYSQALRQQAASPQPTFAPIEDALYTSLGELLIRGHRVPEAQQLYTGWTRANPRSVLARVRLGDLLLQSGQIDQAAGQFRQALKLEAGNPDAQLGLAWVQLYSGRATEAHATFESIHRAEPNAHALFGAALALMQLERLDEAERSFREVLVLDPNYWQAWGNLGDLYDRQGDGGKAADAFRKVLELNPQDQMAREWLRAHPGR